MAFTQVVLHLDEMGLEVHTYFVLVQLGPTGSTVLLNLPRFCNEVMRDPDDMDFGDWIVRRGCVVGALVETRLEALGWIARIEQIPEVDIIFRKLRCQFYFVVDVEVAVEVDDEAWSTQIILAIYEAYV